MRVLFVSAEIYPLGKTGGLADVSAALPRALAALGVDIRVVMPGYRSAMLAATHKTLQAELYGIGGQELTRVFSARLPDSGLPVWLVDCPQLFNRPGGPYQDASGQEWPDNAQRFAHLSRVAAKIAKGKIIRGWSADVVHGNDWHAGLLPLFLANHEGDRPATLFTIHNLAFQGLFPAAQLSSLGLPENLFTPDGIEFHGQLSFLKAGIRYSDRLNTVSPSYARETLMPEFGCGLDGLLESRGADLEGILNGVDYDVWNPATDPGLPAPSHADSMAGKELCKAGLQRELGLELLPRTPLLVWASRITHQKMADIVLDILPEVLKRNVQFALIGQGDPQSERRFVKLAESHPGRMAAHIGYNEPLAHRLYAAGDLLLHPSRFEPCGLTPLYAMRYGTIPIVRNVGGLCDTVVDANEQTIQDASATGFTFSAPTAPAMLACIDRALAVYAKRSVARQMRRAAMLHDSSWTRSAKDYLALYRQLAPNAPLVHAEIERAPANVRAA